MKMMMTSDNFSGLFWKGFGIERNLTKSNIDESCWIIDTQLVHLMHD